MMEKLYPSVERVKEVTAFKTDTRALAAIEALKWLDNGAKHERDTYGDPLSFDMSIFVERLYNDDTIESGCGTACCIAGAISQFESRIKNERYKYHPMGWVFNIRDTDDYSDPLVALFFPRGNGSSFISQKAPDEAAYTLRKYLFTGEVEWK